MFDSKNKCKQILWITEVAKLQLSFTTFTDAAADILWPVAYFWVHSFAFWRNWGLLNLNSSDWRESDIKRPLMNVFEWGALYIQPVSGAYNWMYFFVFRAYRGFNKFSSIVL